MYVQLYDTCVAPTILYGAEIFGYKKSSDFEKIQKRALRFFMGVHKNTPILAMMGDMGWVDINIEQSVCMIRYWNRVIKLDQSRLTKRIFMWDYNLEEGSWGNNVSTILSSIDYSHLFQAKLVCDIIDVENRLIDNYTKSWSSLMLEKPKLRTYVTYKEAYTPEVDLYN